MQRPGLLLLNGVIYAGFGSHCDITPWAGWLVGVSTARRSKLTTLWNAHLKRARTAPTAPGSGTQAMAALSDGNGADYFCDGQWRRPEVGPIAGHSPPCKGLGESIVRVGVQADGTLQATPDFFFSPVRLNHAR